MSNEKLIKELLETALNMEGLENGFLILKDSKGRFYEAFAGDAYTLNGMLDYAKREMFLRMRQMNHKDKDGGEGK